MPITLLTGPINSGKSSALKEKLRFALKVGEATLVLPDRRTAADLRPSLFEGGMTPRAIPREAITDLESFTKKIADPRSPVISKNHSVMLVHRLLSCTPLSYFSRATGSMGLSEQFADAIISLKRAGLSPKVAGKLAANRGAGADREKDLIAVYMAYDEELRKRKLLDEADLLPLAVRRIREGSSPQLFNLSVLFFDEFHRFNPLLLSLIRAIRDARPELPIWISFPVAAGESQGEALFSAYLERGRTLLAELADEEKRLCRDSLSAPETRVICARSPTQEARLAAKLVAELSSGGLPPREIVVAARPGKNFMHRLHLEAASMGVTGEHGPLGDPATSPFMSELLSRKFSKLLPEEASPAEFAARMRDFSPDKEMIAGWSASLARHAAVRTAVAASASAASAFLDALSSIETGAALTGVNFLCRDDFVDMLIKAMPSGISHTAEESFFPFRVMPPLIPLSVSAEAVIIPRMIGGEIPLPLEEPPFFTGWDEPLLAETLPSPADIFAAGAYSFETVVAKCRKKLAFIYPAVDESGGETLRSPFLDRFLPGNAPPEYAPPIIPKPAAASKPGWGKNISLAVSNELSRTGLGKTRRGYSGELSSKEAISIADGRFAERDLRITSLETFAGCPFAFFVSDLLRAKEKREESPELTPLARGIIVHEILKLFYSEHADEAVAARADKSALKRIEKIVSRLAGESWQKYEEELRGVAPGLVERGKRTTEKLVLQVIDTEVDEARRLTSPMKPLQCEWPFGRREGRPFKIEIEGGEEAFLSGRIDRVDADESNSSFIVIDYKTGRAGPVIGEMKKGLHLQLPLYVDAAEKLLCAGARALGGLILDVKNARAGEETHTEGKSHGFLRKDGENIYFRVGRKRSTMADSEFESGIEAARRAAARYVRAIREGKFMPTPGEACRRCKSGDICRRKDMASD